ncbi:hypothetical protein SSX86_020220 [Deinandra increscens subsp. villosa]|uniref:CCT domain-containing protein n=1 Tax=Deinandra increscens subsp. villosa TaxID=3103831 RepID=A0AAP0CMJ7_9ASTR
MAEIRADGGGGTNSYPAGRIFYNFAEPVAREDDDSREISRNVTKSADLMPVFNFGFGIGISTDARFEIESQFHDSVNDGVVPVQSANNSHSHSHSPPAPIADHRSNRNLVEIDFYNRNFQSLSHSVSSSSMENPFILLPVVNGGGMDSDRRGKRLSGTDREARVLRYREKRKKRRFEKKVRYASRKAYAEMRPRIKGRFVKRTEVRTVLDVDRWWFTTEAKAPNAKSYGAGEEYGVFAKPKSRFLPRFRLNCCFPHQRREPQPEQEQDQNLEMEELEEPEELEESEEKRSVKLSPQVLVKKRLVSEQKELK